MNMNMPSGAPVSPQIFKEVLLETHACLRCLPGSTAQRKEPARMWVRRALGED